MRTIAHGNYLIQLRRLVAFNCYLVREQDGFTLVDTGMAGSATAILAAAQQAGAAIRRIALTHAHSDHIGSLDALAARLPAVEVCISAREARLLGGDRGLDPQEPQAKLRGGFVAVTTQPTRLLLPGNRVGSLEVVATPGHTPGHIAFLDLRDHTLIAGDAFHTQAGTAVASTLRWRFPFPALATWHAPTALESARRVRDLSPRRLAVGHGPVIEAPLVQIAQAIAAAERHTPQEVLHGR